jgi:hypothetical protein
MNKQAKNILVITNWKFADPLIQTYTLPYLEIISAIISDDSMIHLFTLEKEASAPPSAFSSKIKVLSAKYYPFGLKAALHWIVNLGMLLSYLRKNKITILHCWGTPSGGLGYILSILTGAELILDSYEPHAEAMVENGTWKKGGLAYRILWYLEKKQSQKASAVIATTSGMKDYAKLKYKTELKSFFVKPACVDLDLFSLTKKKNVALQNELGLKGKITAVYAGKFGGIYLKEEVFQFFAAAWSFWGIRLKVLLLTSHPEIEIRALVKNYGMPQELFIIKYIEHEDIPSFIGLADFALTPVKSVPTKRYCSPIKDAEYWALGIPVIITANISDDSRLIHDHQIGYVWRSNTQMEFDRSILFIDHLLGFPQPDLALKIRSIAEEHRNFSIAQKVYQEIYGTIP